MPEFLANHNTHINHAIAFATTAHGNQVRKGNPHIPYIFHPIDVANEVTDHSGLPVEEIRIAQVIAILHDTVEDTAVTLVNIEDQFGSEVAAGVAALSKDPSISTTVTNKRAEVEENLERLLAAPAYVQCVKLADRTSNLKTFPAMWDREKISCYLDEAALIANTLQAASEGLHARLVGRIAVVRKMLSLYATPST